MSRIDGDSTHSSTDLSGFPFVVGPPTTAQPPEPAKQAELSRDRAGEVAQDQRPAVTAVAASDSTARVLGAATQGRTLLAQATQFLYDSVPNALVAAWIPLAVSVELYLLSRAAEPVYRMGLAMTCLTASFLVWFWLTASLTAHGGARRLVAWHERTTTAKRRLALVTGSLLVASTALAYAVSWGLFLQTGRFAHWEVINFALANPHDIWLYVTQAEPVHLLRGGAIVAACLCAVPLGLRRFASSRTPSAVAPLYRNRIWVWVTILVVMCWLRVVQDPSHRRRTENISHLSHSLNPAVTLSASVAESALSEPIRPVLDKQQLAPLSQAWTPPPVSNQHPSIIVVAVESLRHDVIHQVHQGQEITPNINRLARQGLEWTKAYSQSTHSDYADICIVSSLYPLRTRQHHYYSANDPWPKQLIYDVLRPAGYRTAIISSQNEAWGGMEAFLDTPQLDFFYHPQRSSETHLEILPERDLGFVHEIYTGHLKIGKFPDGHTADKAIAWVEAQAKAGKPFFLSMNLQSSHFPFAMPEDVPRPFQPCELDSDVMFMIYPEERTPKVRNAYYNAVHEADRQVGRLVAALQERHLDDNVILLVIGENGEAFHENNTVGHGREPFEPAIHVATVMWGPRYFEPGVEDYPLEHVDLVPTLFGRLGWASHPNFQGIDALSPERPALEERLLFFHVRSPSAFCDAVQWAGRWKYMWSFDYNNGTLCDLQADPTESRDVSAEHPELAAYLHDRLMEWRARQLAYYHFPAYYRNFYPPAPPRWDAAAPPAP